MKTSTRRYTSVIVNFCLIMGLFLSCKKDMKQDHETINIPEQKPDLTTKVSSSVSGFVTDQNNAAVVGATVKAGTASMITDRYGYFEIKNVQVIKEAATVTITYPGYFKAVKTYMAEEGKSAFFRVKLLQRTIAGTVSAGSGGNVSLNNGTTISFPANAIKDAASGSAYNGTVNVAAQYIDPASAELVNMMPGDLRGINADGYMKELTSYGMIAVELVGDAGQSLQIADGKKSTLTMPVPNAALSFAPATIPLWHFDENSGLWKEEGSVTKNGNNYVGDVSHFSCWNIDIPNATVQVNFTVVNFLNMPVGNVYADITPIGPNAWGHCGGYVDASGYVSVPLTPNTQYELRISSTQCGDGFSQIFSVETQPLSLGNITIGTGLLAYIRGTATDCNNNPISQGKIITSNQFGYSVSSTNVHGNYNIAYFICDAIVNTTLIAEDPVVHQQSSLQNINLVAGLDTIINLQACGTAY